MDILFLAHRIPYPPNKGEKIRAYEQLRHLAARHAVDLFCLADSPEEAKGRAALQSLCRSVHVEVLPRSSRWPGLARALMAGQPLTNAWFWSARMQTAVNAALAENSYDVIFVYCSSVAQYVPRSAPAPVVIDFVDADSAKWAQYAQFSRFPMSRVYAREARCLARYEREIARVAAAAVATTRLEAAALNWAGNLPVTVIGNGVTLRANDQPPPAAVRNLGQYILFSGTMDYLPNVDAACFFAEKVLPRVRAVKPEVRFVVVGRNPTRRVRQLGRLPGLVVLGEVPDVHPYVVRAAVAVAPFRISQGVHNKILEALAAGVPVVSTSRPAEAAGLCHGEALQVADTPETFAVAVLAALERPTPRFACPRLAALLRTQFNWTANLSQLEQLLAEVAGQAHDRECVAGPRAMVR